MTSFRLVMLSFFGTFVLLMPSHTVAVAELRGTPGLECVGVYATELEYSYASVFLDQNELAYCGVALGDGLYATCGLTGAYVSMTAPDGQYNEISASACAMAMDGGYIGCGDGEALYDGDSDIVSLDTSIWDDTQGQEVPYIEVQPNGFGTGDVAEIHHLTVVFDMENEKCDP